LTPFPVNYGYDDLGELTSATGYEPSGTARANENFGYGYDLAGNLLLRTNNTLIQEFTLDNANEVVNIQRDNNLLTVAGSLNGPVKSLAINGLAAAVYGDTTYAVPTGVVVTNGLNMLAAVVNGTQTNQLGEFLPVGVQLQYDLNGNLISDGQRTYAYDCANELIQVTTTNVSIAGSTTTTNSYLTKYAYDGFGRRRVGQEYQWGPITAQPGTACGWVAVNTVRYLYDGMTVLQERDGNNNLLVDYTRGLDLWGGGGGRTAGADGQHWQQRVLSRGRKRECDDAGGQFGERAGEIFVRQLWEHAGHVGSARRDQHLPFFQQGNRSDLGAVLLRLSVLPAELAAVAKSRPHRRTGGNQPLWLRWQ
jgi:hypothetical protein